MTRENPLPWPLVRLSAVASLIRGVSFAGAQAQDTPQPNHVPVLRAGNISDRLILETDLIWVPESRVSADQRLRFGDIAICMSSGSGAVVGKTAMIEREWEGSVGAFCAIIRPCGYGNANYLAAYLKGSQFEQWRKDKAQGANIQNLRGGELLAVPIPLPPLSEQERIVEILHEAEGIRRLRAKAEAEAENLLPTIFERTFGDPVLNQRKWCTKPLAALINGTPKNGLYKPADRYGEGTPIIRIGDFTAGILRNPQGLQRVRISEDEADQFRVANGQVLINRVNSIEHLGKSLLAPCLAEPTVFESNMMRLDPNLDEVVPEFLTACLQHPSLVAKLRSRAKRAVQQASVNQTDVLTLELPVPPMAMQRSFRARVADIGELRILGERAMRAERALSASLSAHSFSGQLTAVWREANEDRLAIEAQQRDATLRGSGATLSGHRRPTAEDEIDAMLQDRTDGIYPDLNREQLFLLREIERFVGGARHPRYFSAEKLCDHLREGPMHGNALAIEGHLAVLAARGLVVPLSREEEAQDTGGLVFGNTYRLPLKDYEPRDGEEGEPRVGDFSRLRELERLAAELAKERGLP